MSLAFQLKYMEDEGVHSSPKEGQCQRISNYYRTAHASKVMLKILQARLQQQVTENFQMYKLDLEKAEETEIKLLTSAGLQKRQENSRKTSTSVSLTMQKPLTVWITTNWKILKEMGIPDQLIYLLRNLYAGQEATVRTRHGTTDCFKTGKGVSQGYKLMQQNEECRDKPKDTVT